MHRRLGLFLVVLALVASGCGGGGESNRTSVRKQSATTTTSADDETSTTGGDVTTTTVKGATTTTAKGAAASPTTKAGSTAPTANPNAAPTPARTGTYDYAQSGSTSTDGPVPPQGTLLVSGEGPSQIFLRDFDPSTPASDFDIYYSFRDDGPFITKLVVREEGVAITCTFGSPVPAPPWPPTTGRSFSGQATCNNGFTADFSGSITGRTNDVVGGTSVEAIVINSTLHVRGNGADITIRDTQHWAPSLRVPTYSHEVVNGTAPFVGPVSGDVTSKLTSISPR